MANGRDGGNSNANEQKKMSITASMTSHGPMDKDTVKCRMLCMYE